MIKFTDKILDNVHGFIDITDVEKSIIELPIFKRLQHIKQLSLVDWVFPGAEHTRYIHSLGVMHVADQMAIHLNYDDEHRILVRLAGLLHDLGHYPLSHEGETAYMDSYDKADEIITNNAQHIKEKIDKIDDALSLSRMSIPKEYHHERITIKVITENKSIAKIIAKGCSNYPLVSIENICDIITGNTKKKELSGLIQLIHSELDADRIDYLMRDATFSGTCYGTFELGFFLRNLRKCQYQGFDIVGISKKGIAMADQFLINRFFSYNQVVFNRHVAILGKMVSLLMSEYRQNQSFIPKENFSKHIEEHEKTEIYNKFTDVLFWSELHKDNKLADELLNKISKALLHNDEIGCVSDEKMIISDDWAKIKEELQSTSMYQNLISPVKEKLQLFHQMMFTNQIPINKYLEQAGKENYQIEDMVVRVYQEAIVVLDEEGDKPILLVDCKESIMNQLYKTKLCILREYSIK